MESNKFTVTNFTISDIISKIRSEEVAIPEIQRPFVWKSKQVRDLIDSLYNGYPTGYLITWANPSVRLKNGEMSGNRMTLIDGQQRVTAIMAAIVGKEVFDKNYRRKRIAIAFNPFPEPGTERFEVQDSSHLKSRRWIPNISVVFDPSFSTYSFIGAYCKDNPDVNADDLNNEIDKLRTLQRAQIGCIVLNSDLDIDTVTEIFVRINSKGTVLDQTDFVMSKMAANTTYGGEAIRKRVDYFCRLIEDPTFYRELKEADPEFFDSYGPSMKWIPGVNNPMYRPAYKDVLRVSFMCRNDRAKMADLVSLLSGRNFTTKTYEEEIIENSFRDLSEGVRDFTNEYNFKQFLICLSSTGFSIPKQVTSDMTADFAYSLFIRLRESGMDMDRVKAFVGRWFVMSNLTGRYTNSPESAMDRDLRMIRDKGFEQYLDEIESAELSDSFWEVALVQALNVSRYSNPLFYTYLAAQMMFDTRSLLSLNTRVYELANTDIGDVHHIFPKAYLAKNGFPPNMYNQIANYAYIDRSVNNSIADLSPKEYFSTVKGQCESKNPRIGDITDADDLRRNLEMNCIPDGIFDMEYPDYEKFLFERRKMMAARIREYYEKIKSRC